MRRCALASSRAVASASSCSSVGGSEAGAGGSLDVFFLDFEAFDDAVALLLMLLVVFGTDPAAPPPPPPPLAGAFVVRPTAPAGEGLPLILHRFKQRVPLLVMPSDFCALASLRLQWQQHAAAVAALGHMRKINEKL